MITLQDFNASLAAQVAFPPDTQCWANLTWLTYDGMPIGLAETTQACAGTLELPVTEPMVAFLNLTTNFDYYFQAYCLNPRSDDSCPFNYCPQPDVAGVLVRISTYISTLCLAILLFSCHEPEETAEAFKSQVLTLLSILVAAGTSISQTSLTKFHAIIALELVASPIMFYVVIYAIRSLFNHRHRLDHLFGHGRVLTRLFAVGTLLIWISLFIYVMLPSDLQQFSQASCDAKSAVVNLTFLAPFRISAAQFQAGGSVASFVVFIPFVMVISSWMSTVYIRRNELWNSTEKCRYPTFWSVWTMVGNSYPFIHFMAMYMIPFSLWVLTVELSLVRSNDQSVQASFGQILAVSVTIPPLMSVAKKQGQFKNWFLGLAWVQYVLRRHMIANDGEFHGCSPRNLLIESARSSGVMHPSSQRYSSASHEDFGRRSAHSNAMTVVSRLFCGKHARNADLRNDGSTIDFASGRRVSVEPNA